MKVSFCVIAALFFISANALAQSSASDTFVGKIKVWAPITLNCTADMAFPDIVANVAVAGGLRTTDASPVPGGASGHNMTCTVTGQVGKQFRVTRPATPISFLVETDIKIDSIDYPSGGDLRTLTTSPYDFEVNGKLQAISAGAVPNAGDYETAALTISVAYNNI